MKMFPLQTQRDCQPGPRQIPWSVAEIAYGEYSRLYGSSQTLERLAERGGFRWGEMDSLFPGWREKVDEINILRKALQEALFVLGDYNQFFCDECKTVEQYIEYLRKDGRL